jgi:hypothetical protein
VPVLLSSLIDVPAGELAGVLAADESRCCLREWLARVPAHTRPQAVTQAQISNSPGPWVVTGVA